MQTDRPIPRKRAPNAWRDPALWAWVVVAVFALVPLSHVMASVRVPAASRATNATAAPPQSERAYDSGAGSATP